MVFEYKITEVDGEFFINDEDDAFPTRDDEILAIENHCEDEGAEYIIK